ncbi:hypothetical protein [Desulfosarcina ovata]|uniref:HhH-GPD domain-containing protein n=1 Tax=Desulfosarcina ovata subsp. ovata TaxID=2752305 RepID=A0A5K8AJL9_9BACT|nr:hypothetical protein [Desulfosarcina ovata]BBO92892.1 hypothetical protein DSCOOX_60720 [Desulfosarcina ovata subsp. ovata]
MYIKTLKIKCPDNYSLDMTCHVHGWKNLAPFEWHVGDQSLSFSCYALDTPIDLRLWQKQDYIEIRVESDSTLSPSEVEQIFALINRSLGLEVRTEALLEIADKVGAEYVALVKNGAGRMLRSPSLWEDASKTLFTTNCTWALTKHMCHAVCSAKFSRPTPNNRYPFPKPEIFKDLEPNEIENLMPIGYRSHYFINLAKRFSQDSRLDGIEMNGYDFNSAYKIVASLNGFGPYASNHLMILCGYFDEVPIDTVVISYLKNNYRVRKPEAFIRRHYKKWKKFRWWGFTLEKMLNKQNWLGD